MPQILEQNTGDKAPKEGPRSDAPAAPDYGDPKRFEKLPENLQAKLRDLLRKAQMRDQFARRQELRRAQKNRFFELGMQHLEWDEDHGLFQVGQQGGGFQEDAEDEGPLYQRDIQNYLGYEKSFRSVFCQNSPTVRFQPEDPKEPIDVTASQEAGKMKRVIEKFNDPKGLQDDVGRLLWTDGSVIAYSRTVTDGQRFGFEEEDGQAGDNSGGDGADDGVLPGEASGAGRTAKGREVIDMYGVLECKRPLSIRDRHRWPYLIISNEEDIATEKAEYPDVEDKLSSGAKAPGSEHYARMARIACSQGANWKSSASTLDYLVTVDRGWFRPSFFTEVGEKNDPDRQELERIYPDGCHAVFIGDVYCASRNESMDDHIKHMTVLRAGTQAVPGLGNALLDPAEAFDDMFNMSEEAYKFCIPAKIFRNKVLDLEAINEQKAQYGGYYEANQDPQPDKPFGDNFFEETPVTPPAEMGQQMIQIQGPLMQFLSGQLAPLMGQADEHNETAKGISILRDQALGLMSLIWTPFTVFYGEVMLDAVRCAAHDRDPEKPLNTLVDVPGKKGQQEPIEVSIEDLKGNVLTAPVVDTNFPESWSAKSNRFFQIFSQAPENPILLQLLEHPDNLALAKDMLGLEDFEVPQADSRDKQLQEIARLSKESPLPPTPEELLSAMQQQEQQYQTAIALMTQAGFPVPPPEAGQEPGAAPALPQHPQIQQLVQQLTKSSVEVDPLCDDHQVEAAECLRWINSPQGQKAKNSPEQEDRLGYQNVRLHFLEHMAAAKAQQPPQPPVEAAAGHPPKSGGPPPPQVGGPAAAGAAQ